MYLTKLLTLFIFIFALVLAVSADDTVSKIDNLISLYQEYGQFDGAILVVKYGQVIFKKGYGFANREWKIPNTPNTKFRIASISKQFTAMLIMQLVEQKKIRLDGVITDYLPYYRKDTGSKVTIHQLLNHTSGIPSYTNIPGFWQNKMRDPYHPDTLIVNYCSADFEFEPGSEYKYNNSGYVILGAIIEHVSGKSYEEMLRSNIFEPLSMRHSGFDHHKTILSKRADGYDKNIFGYQNTAYIDMSAPYAAGALYSTVEDLFLWDQALYTEKLLSTAYRNIMFTPELNNYAYGWGVYNLPISETGDSTRAVAHSGGINGFNCRILRLIDDNHTVIILRNAPGAPIRQINRAVVAILFDQPYELPKKSAADEVGKRIVSKGIEQGLNHFKKLKADNTDTYNFSENEFNTLGYSLLRFERIEDAILIFQLNVKEYPGSANVYDSLAEAYMTGGNSKMAIKYYKKTLEMLDQDKNISNDFRERLRKGATENIKKMTEQSS
jgi:CubicO group peptidase (beta-lactamase class C family)